MTASLTVDRNAAAALPAIVSPSIALPLTLTALLALGLVAMQAHLLCDVLCLHGEAYRLSTDICHG